MRSVNPLSIKKIDFDTYEACLTIECTSTCNNHFTKDYVQEQGSKLLTHAVYQFTEFGNRGSRFSYK